MKMLMRIFNNIFMCTDKLKHWLVSSFFSILFSLTFQGFQEQMIGSAREIHDLCSKVKDSAKAEPENLGHRVSTAIRYVRKGGLKDSCVHGSLYFVCHEKRVRFIILFKLFTCIFTCDMCNNGHLFGPLSDLLHYI